MHSILRVLRQAAETGNDDADESSYRRICQVVLFNMISLSSGRIRDGSYAVGIREAGRGIHNDHMFRNNIGFFTECGQH